MTIAAGFVASDGILLCTDSQYTAGDKTYHPKILSEDCGSFRVAFAMSGDTDYAKTAVDDSFDAVEAVQSRRLPEAKKAIRQVLKRVIRDYDQAQPDRFQRPAFLIAISDGNKSVLFSTRDTAISKVGSYAFLGSGAYLGEFIIP